jgi:DEAD/DEAH box helicase domain-containing protein
VEKISDGLQAIRWYREGRLLDIAEYCCYDVKITRLVHEHGLTKKQLNYVNRFGRTMTVAVSWGP